jgi:hypothetical protein
MENLQTTQARFFGQVELAILASSELTSNDKLVYCAIARYRNARSGWAWPGRDKLAQLSGLHVDSISRCTARLAKAGFLIVTHKTGNRAAYRLPLADVREAERKARAPSGANAAQRKKREKPVPAGALPESGSDAGDRTSRARSSSFDEDERNPPQTPPFEPAPAEPADVACGECADQQPDKPAPLRHEARKLVFPEGLPALLCVQLGRMLASTPEAVAQELLDEMAYNARFYPINTPGGYIRRLLSLRQRGEFVPEVAHFERQRREKIAANEQARQLAERRHLEALAQGQLPSFRPPPAQERTPEEEAAGLAALAAIRANLGMKPRTH